MHQPEARFSNYSLPTVHIRWEVRLIVVPLLAIRSQQIFAHATTVQLSCQVQNFVAITVIVSGWEWNVISTKFELRWKNRHWKGAQNGKRQQSVRINHMSYNRISFMSPCGSIYNTHCLPRISSPPESLRIVGAFHLSQEGRTQGDFIYQQTVILRTVRVFAPQELSWQFRKYGDANVLPGIDKLFSTRIAIIGACYNYIRVLYMYHSRRNEWISS